MSIPLSDMTLDAVFVQTDDPRLTDARDPKAHAHAADDITGLVLPAAIPIGVIVMWAGLLSLIPAGWVLCNGQNGTPDLRDRFIKGAAAGQNPGATGGNATHTHAGHASHTVTQPVSHGTHQHTYSQVPNHVHVQTVNSATTGGLSGYTPDTSTNTAAASGYSTQNPTGGVAQGTTDASAALTHSGTAVDAHSAHDSANSEPAYFSLCFIQKVSG